MPPSILKLATGLEKNDPKKLAEVLSKKVIVIETAYEVGGGACAAYVRKTSMTAGKSLNTILARLKRAWHISKIEDLDGEFGLVGEGDCEHVWSVGLTQDQRKLTGLR